MAVRITEFNRGNIRNVLDKAQEALNTLGKEFGLIFEMDTTRTRANKDSMAVTLEVKLDTPQGQKSRQQIEFEANCGRFGLTPADYRKVITTQRRSYYLVGFNLQAVKYPFQGEHIVTGTIYKLPPSALPAAAAHAGFGPRKPLFGDMAAPPIPGYDDDGGEFERRFSASMRAEAAAELRAEGRMS